MSDTTYYKVSFVIEGKEHPGAIIDMPQPPHIGQHVTLDGMIFSIVRIEELMAPKGDFGFLHAVCQFVKKA